MIHCRFRALCRVAVISLICAAASASAQTELSPLDPGLGRIVIYRPWHYVGGAAGSMVALNGEFMGMCRAGKYFYIDMKPGAYYMQTYFLSLGAMTNAAKQTFAVHAGQTAYVKLNMAMSYSIEMIPADQAGKELAHVHYDPSAVAEKDVQSAKHVDRARLDFEQYNQASGLEIAPAQQTASANEDTPGTLAQTSRSSTGLFSRANRHPVADQPQPASEQPAQTEAAPATVPALSGAAARITLAVTSHCAKDPDPMGFVSMSMYSGCKQKEMNELRSQIAGAFAQRHVTLADGDAGDLRITVTLTKEEDKRPSSFMPFGDFMTGTMDYEAIYQITDASGRVVHSGNITQQGPDSHPVNVEKQFAAKVADTLTPQLAAPAPAPAPASITPQAEVATSTPQPAPAAHVETPVELAAQANLYEILAQAYRYLAVKPVLPDDARQQKLKAEDALKAHDPNAAGAAYAAALKSANWWPEGFRGLALALSQTNHTEQAIVWMRRYLEFVPNAPDAAQMQTLIDVWSQLAPPPPLPTSFPVPPGLHLGVASVDTPSIVAMASGNPDLEGALIAIVYSGSPAEAAGLAKGDIILSYNGAPVRNAQDLIANASKAAPGASAELEVQRGQTKISIKVQYLAKSSEPEAQNPKDLQRTGK